MWPQHTPSAAPQAPPSQRGLGSAWDFGAGKLSDGGTEVRVCHLCLEVHLLSVEITDDPS